MDAAARQRLAADNRGLAYALARRLWERWPPSRLWGSRDDLEGECLLALVKAARGYDPRHLVRGKAVRFSTYACRVIAHNVCAAAQKAGIVRLPRSAWRTDPAAARRACELQRLTLTEGDLQPGRPGPAPSRRGELEAALAALTFREEWTVRWWFGLGCRRLTQARVGRYFGLSKQRVEQIQRAALARLREVMGDG